MTEPEKTPRPDAEAPDTENVPSAAGEAGADAAEKPGFAARLKATFARLFPKKEDDGHYISTRESTRISRENARITRMYEKK